MNRPELFDSHTHLQFAAYDQDREEVIKRTLEAGIWAVNVGTQLDTSRAAIELAENHLGLYAAVGLHPIHTHESFHDAEEFDSGATEEGLKSAMKRSARIISGSPRTRRWWRSASADWIIFTYQRVGKRRRR